MNDEHKVVPKPPRGLVPRCNHEHARIDAILAAMQRFTTAYKPIPVEWLTELTHLNAHQRTP